MRAEELLRRARKVARDERSEPSDDMAGVLAECFAATIAATRDESTPREVAAALGATVSTLHFYFPEHRGDIKEGFEEGQKRAREACLDEEGIGRA